MTTDELLGKYGITMAFRGAALRLRAGAVGKIPGQGTHEDCYPLTLSVRSTAQKLAKSVGTSDFWHIARRPRGGL